ncbi:MAG: SprT family zinc-dependent metalloprotease [Gallionella sp.]
MLKSLHPRTSSSPEQRDTLLAGQSVTYTLKRSGNRRSIGLRIDGNGLTVSMPLRASEKWLHEVLQDKAEWVVAKLQGWEDRKPIAVKFHDGAALDYLGDLLTLRIDRGLFIAPAQKRGNELWVFLSANGTEKQIAREVQLWYRAQALQLYQQRAELYALMLEVAPREIKLSSAKTQWGCCTAGGTVRLNLQLIKLPVKLIDYVVVHELAHLREMNHSAAFWQIVKSACPDYLKLRAELKAVAL